MSRELRCITKAWRYVPQERKLPEFVARDLPNPVASRVNEKLYDERI